jgi:hypothetical protein
MNKDLLDLTLQQLAAQIESGYRSFVFERSGDNWDLKWEQRTETYTKSQVYISVRPGIFTANIRYGITRTGESYHGLNRLNVIVSKFGKTYRMLNKLRERHRWLVEHEEETQARNGILKALEATFPMAIDNLILGDKSGK